MNMKYMVDERGKIKVITDKGIFIDTKKQYTKNTDTILYLENMLESIEEKIKFLTKRIGELNNSIKNKTRIFRYINISLILLMFVLLALGIATVTKLFLFITILSIPLASIIKKIENIIIEKDKNKRNYFKEKVQEEICKINKINKRINTLQQENIIIEPKLINTPIDVKELEDYMIDSSDYFIDSYLINKRVEEMTRNMPKVKKKTRKKTNFEYEI